MGFFDDIEDAFKDLGDDLNPKKVIEKAAKDVKKIADRVVKDAEREIKDIGDDVAEDLSKDLVNVYYKGTKEIRKAGEAVVDEIEEVAEKAIEGIKDAFDSGFPELAADVGIPQHINIQAKVLGNGVSAKYSENQEVIKEVFELIRTGKPNLEILYEILPDSITVHGGVDVALVVTANLSYDMTYDTKDDIIRVVEWIKSKV